MKKLVLTIAILLGLGLTTFADPQEGGLFQRGVSDEEYYGFGARTEGNPSLPAHRLFGNQNAPLGSGVAIMLSLGAVYLIRKKREE